jgi:SAM-dependent methyltransferase
MADHPQRAAVHDRLTGPVGRAALAERRHRLLGEARGKVLEIGGGTGRSLDHYRAGLVERVDVIEPDGALRRRLQARAASAPVPVRVHPGGAADPFPDPPYDTAVCCLVLCTVPDLPGAAGRLITALAPGGRLLFLEHLRSPGWRGRAQHTVTPIWSRVVPGCHLDRDVLGALRAAGFVVTDADRFRVPQSGGVLHDLVQGTAVERIRPEAAA